jgi:hypothetical protein
MWGARRLVVWGVVVSSVHALELYYGQHRGLAERQCSRLRSDHTHCTPNGST